MRYISLRLLAIVVIASFFAGCSSINHVTAPSSAPPDLTGDWAFGITALSGPGPLAITELNGALSGGGQNINGVFQAIEGTGCVSPTFDIAFTGSQDSAGDLTLTSTNLPGNVATITIKGTEFLDGNTFGLGDLIITGSGPCAETSSALLGGEVLNITGTYTGSLTAGLGGAATPFNVSLAEVGVNTNGQFPVTGTVTVTGPGCTNVFSLSGLVSGLNFNASLTSTSGPSATGNLFIEAIDSAQPGSQDFGALITGSGCNNNGYSGSLTKQ
jgi:hypothetical protein